MSDCGLDEVSVTAQKQLLHRFPALEHVNISGNPKLGAAGVTSLVSSLAGAYHQQTHAHSRSFLLFKARCDECCSRHQEH